MFCSACGAKLFDDAKFCFNCGARIGESPFALNGRAKTQIVPAKCTNCGASLNVDEGQNTAVCPYCNSKFIVDQAIMNYNITANGNISVNGATININGKNIDNLLKRAKEFALSGDFEKARNYYNEVLDSDVNNAEAANGVACLDAVLNDYVYMSETNGDVTTELRQGRLIVKTPAGPTMYELKRVFNVDVASKGLFSNGKIIKFLYKEVSHKNVTLSVTNTSQWFVAIEDAKMGKYPAMKNLGKLFQAMME